MLRCGGKHTSALLLLARSPQWSPRVASYGSFLKKGKKKTKSEASEDSEAKQFDEAMWKIRPHYKTLTRTRQQLAEEAELVLAYNKLKLTQHRQIVARLSKALKMKLAALNELPPDLRSAAMAEDLHNPPRERVIPGWTAPIPNYQHTLPPEERDEPFDFSKLASMRKRSR